MIIDLLMGLLGSGVYRVGRHSKIGREQGPPLFLFRDNQETPDLSDPKAHGPLLHRAFLNIFTSLAVFHDTWKDLEVPGTVLCQYLRSQSGESLVVHFGA